MYVETLANLRTRKPAAQKNTAPTEAEKEQQAKAYYANVRSNVSKEAPRSLGLPTNDPRIFNQVLLTWVLSNVRSINFLRGRVLMYLFRAFSWLPS